jgi:SGNH domain (fused to AT3 domains)
MTRASALRAALIAAVAALLMSLLVAFPGPAASVAPDPSDDHPWLPRSCVATPADYVPDHAGACHLTPYKPNRPTVVLWGDSHAWQHLPAIEPLARKRHVNLVMFMLGGCPPILVRPNFGGTLYACEKSNQLALKFVNRLKKYDKSVRVLLGAYWDGYYSVYKGLYVDQPPTVDPSDYTVTQLRSARTFHRLTPKLIAELGGLGVRTDLIGQAATVPANPPFCLRGNDPYECSLKRSVALPHEQLWTSWFKRQLNVLPAGSRVVRFNYGYCGKTKCQGYTDGMYTFFDPIHLSATRTATFRKYFAPTFRGLG